MTGSVTLQAPAKINLYLHVTGKRDDGYHLLDSIAVFAQDIADIIHVEEAKEFSFTLSGPFVKNFHETDLNAEAESTNLVVRAAYLMASLANRPLTCAIHLEKNIPLGAGLGGGSSDAAATIKALEDLWNFTLPRDQKNALLTRIGADVPACYEAAPCRFQGIGDILSPVPPLPQMHALLIWPNAHASTRDVFANRKVFFRDDPVNIPSSFDKPGALIDFLLKQSNDLTQAAESLCPDIHKARQFLTQEPGCRLARMSGSGTSVFGLFETQDAFSASFFKARDMFPDWWIKGTKL